MNSVNTALWLPGRGRQLKLGPAPTPEPGEDEVVVRVRAVAVNFIDAMPGFAYRVVLPWLRFPAVIGSDVAGEVVAVGSNVNRLQVGERVVGHAVGIEKSRNTAAEGAFQHLVVLMQHMVAPIPDSLAFEQAAVLPLALSTAATGLFQADHLALAMPGSGDGLSGGRGSGAGRGSGTDFGNDAGPESEAAAGLGAHHGQGAGGRRGAGSQNSTVLVWGASTSVGINAVQLARNAGYRVVATASPRNHDWVRSLGAAEVVDYRSDTAVGKLVERIGDHPLAGTIAIGRGSLPPSIKVARRTEGSRRVASAHPDPVTRLRAWRARGQNVQVSAIWGGSLKDNEVGPAIYGSFLPQALASGDYQAEPKATVVGHGLESIPAALERLRQGISREKLVVTIP